MKKTSLMKILYGYILSQIAVLCITASVLGVMIAGERTEYMQNGARSVSVQVDKPAKDINAEITARLIADKIKRTVCALPAPIGNIAGIIVCIEKFVS